VDESRRQPDHHSDLPSGAHSDTSTLKWRAALRRGLLNAPPGATPTQSTAKPGGSAQRRPSTGDDAGTTAPEARALRRSTPFTPRTTSARPIAPVANERGWLASARFSVRERRANRRH
jgi:hypothetical protein